MSDPFKINSPTCISFSGGRTSAYMLWRVLESNGGLPDEAVVCFANTGKEEEATLKFVNDCSVNWDVPIAWLEYVSHPEPSQRFKVVSYETANRTGDPFEAVIRHYGKLPNPINKVCTAELKIRAVGRFLSSLGWEDWDSMIGIRADEPRRAAKLRSDRKGELPIAPLFSAGVDVHEVGAFWDKQPFNLELRTFNGRTLAGNCDLCYLKPAAQLQSLIQEKPERAIWWIQMEEIAKGITDGVANRFHLDRPSYAQMLKFSKEQKDMFDPKEEAISCFCGD
jgi:3'-phosphoadenosine 5'-phosphosulfate sulfotransferase (PAPS reductase)/FAD synthetase